MTVRKRTQQRSRRTMIRADGEEVARMRDARGFVLLSMHAKALTLRGGGPPSSPGPKSPWRIAPPRGWAFASVQVADWTVDSPRSPKAMLGAVDVGASLELAVDDRLEVRAVCACDTSPPDARWRALVQLQVSFYGPVPRLSSGVRSLPRDGSRRHSTTLPRAAARSAFD